MSKRCSLFIVIILIGLSAAGNLIRAAGPQNAGKYRIEKRDNESEEDAYQRGKREAQQDLDNRALKMKTYGGPPPNWYPRFINILKQEYQIEMVSVAGCLVSKPLLANVKGYNEVAEPAIKARYGNDIFSRVEKQAIKETEQANKKK